MQKQHLCCYPEEIFLDIKSVEPFICPIDLGVPYFNNLVTDKHGHTLCKYCIQSWLKIKQSCPISNDCMNSDELYKASLHQINSLRYLQCKCMNQNCEWQGKFEELQDHLYSQCLYQYTNCKNFGCSYETQRNKLDQHIQICVFRIIHCPFCKRLMQHQSFKLHIEFCKQSFVCCIYCQKTVSTQEIKTHQDNYCQEQNDSRDFFLLNQFKILNSKLQSLEKKLFLIKKNQFDELNHMINKEKNLQWFLNNKQISIKYPFCLVNSFILKNIDLMICTTFSSEILVFSITSLIQNQESQCLIKYQLSSIHRNICNLNGPFFTCSNDLQVTIFKIQSNSIIPLYHLNGHNSKINSLHFMQNLNCIISAGVDQIIGIWQFLSQFYQQTRQYIILFI